MWKRVARAEWPFYDPRFVGNLPRSLCRDLVDISIKPSQFIGYLLRNGHQGRVGRERTLGNSCSQLVKLTSWLGKRERAFVIQFFLLLMNAPQPATNTLRNSLIPFEFWILRMWNRLKSDFRGLGKCPTGKRSHCNQCVRMPRPLPPPITNTNSLWDHLANRLSIWACFEEQLSSSLPIPGLS